MNTVVNKKVVELFYDVISPYSWVAFEILCRYQSKWNMDLKFRPFLLGAIMKESSNQPPMMIPNKGKYMAKDLKRISQLYQIPLNQPKNLFEALIEKGSLKAQRLLTHVQMTKPEILESLSRELWIRIWSKDEDISQEDGLKEALQKVGFKGEQVDSCLAAIKDQAVKDKLISTTKEALDLGAFGAPTIVATIEDGKKELIFGSDHFEVLAMLIGEKYFGPLNELSKL